MSVCKILLQVRNKLLFMISGMQHVPIITQLLLSCALCSSIFSFTSGQVILYEERFFFQAESNRSLHIVPVCIKLYSISTILSESLFCDNIIPSRYMYFSLIYSKYNYYKCTSLNKSVSVLWDYKWSKHWYWNKYRIFDYQPVSFLKYNVKKIIK